jgi:hypothetical protein
MDDAQSITQQVKHAALGILTESAAIPISVWFMLQGPGGACFGSLESDYQSMNIQKNSLFCRPV